MIEYTGLKDWTFADANTREYTHIYHDYPARMIPQIPSSIIEILNIKEGSLLFDPYCGSGSTLVEGVRKGLNVIGTDINPLAQLISTAKTDYLTKIEDLENEINKFISFTMVPKGNPKIIDGNNLNFWFKENAINRIGLIMRYISNIKDAKIKNFFKVAASETIRESSNTRKSEFKLYRYAPDKLIKHNPDPFSTMNKKLSRNLKGYREFHAYMAGKDLMPDAKIKLFNTVNQLPPSIAKKNSVDIVITSPPYGDSHTTVAYGQYSKLSSMWLGIYKEDVDKLSMGGVRKKELEKFDCESLDKAISEVFSKNNKRGIEVSAFYSDLQKSIENVSKLIKNNGYSCYVVANRIVAGVKLPTDDAIRCFYQECGFTHFDTFTRVIPNKRMPLRNSPSNKTGITEETMSKEYIVIMKKN